MAIGRVDESDDSGRTEQRKLESNMANAGGSTEGQSGVLVRAKDGACGEGAIELRALLRSFRNVRAPVSVKRGLNPFGWLVTCLSAIVRLREHTPGYQLLLFAHALE